MTAPSPQPAPSYYVERCGGLTVYQPVRPKQKDAPMNDEFQTIDHHDDNLCGETALCVDCISYLAEDGDAA